MTKVPITKVKPKTKWKNQLYGLCF